MLPLARLIPAEIVNALHSRPEQTQGFPFVNHYALVVLVQTAVPLGFRVSILLLLLLAGHIRVLDKGGVFKVTFFSFFFISYH